MGDSVAVFTIVSGPNKGDSIQLDLGSCRLIGRHLSENETALIDRDGNRVIDGQAAGIIEEHLQDKAPQQEEFRAETFERGADIILSDDAISRAHAMVFHDQSGPGIIDLASTNGTLVNQESVTSRILKNGDSIELGGSTLTIDLN